MEVIKLKYPLNTNEGEIKELKIRRPKVRDQLAVQKLDNPAEQEIRLFSNLCEIDKEIIADLDMYDYQKLQKAFNNFLS